MVLHNVSISDPAQNGEATTEGYGFVYKARPNFKGEDAFSVTMTGLERGIRGTTIVRVRGGSSSSPARRIASIDRRT